MSCGPLRRGALALLAIPLLALVASAAPAPAGLEGRTDAAATAGASDTFDPTLRLLLLGTLLFGSGAAAAAVVWHRRRARADGSSPRAAPGLADLREPYERRAAAAADASDFVLAADLLARARTEEPSRRDLAHRHATYLWEAGRLDAAMSAFDAASYERGDGEPERMAALCAVRLGEHAKAAYFLYRALARATERERVTAIADEPTFQSLLVQPTLSLALQEARRRVAAQDAVAP